MVSVTLVILSIWVLRTRATLETSGNVLLSQSIRNDGVWFHFSNSFEIDPSVRLYTWTDNGQMQKPMTKNIENGWIEVTEILCDPNVISATMDIFYNQQRLERFQINETLLVGKQSIRCEADPHSSDQMRVSLSNSKQYCLYNGQVIIDSDSSSRQIASIQDNILVQDCQVLEIVSRYQQSLGTCQVVAPDPATQNVRFNSKTTSLIFPETMINCVEKVVAYGRVGWP